MDQTKVFLLTFLAYTSLTSVRYGWAYSKPQLHQATGITMRQLGIIDFLYVSCYSFGFMILGSLLHKTTLKRYVILGIIVSCICYMIYPFYFSKTHQQNQSLLILLMGLNGFFQASIWPGIMGIFGNWFKSKQKGILLAVLVISGNVGNIYALIICNILELQNTDWFYNYIFTGCLGIVVSILMILFLQQKPKQQQDLIACFIQQQSKNKSQLKQRPERQLKQETLNQNQSLFALLRFPKVPRYVTAFACLKGCSYGLVFWMPTYFYSKGESLNDQKGFIISMYDVGSIFGTLMLGYLVDKFNKRALIVVPLLFFALIQMFIITYSLDAVWQYYIAMFFTGVCISGPYNVISTVVTMDLGQTINQKSAVAKVSSLIEGVSSIMSAFSMLIIPMFSFQFILYIFATQCLISIIAIFPLFWQQAKTLDVLKKKLKSQVLNPETENIQMQQITLKAQEIKCT